MSKLAWTPWHQVVEVRGDLKSGESSLAIFAADLYDVMMGRALTILDGLLRLLGRLEANAPGRRQRVARSYINSDIPFAATTLRPPECH